MTNRLIVVNLRFEGIHYWEEAEKLLPEVGFLSFPHRHIFHIKVIKRVHHNDRDIEIILFKRKIEEFLKQKFPNGKLNKMSCEDLAELIFAEFECEEVEVMEDGENGALLRYTK